MLFFLFSFLWNIAHKVLWFYFKGNKLLDQMKTNDRYLRITDSRKCMHDNEMTITFASYTHFPIIFEATPLKSSKCEKTGIISKRHVCCGLILFRGEHLLNMSSCIFKAKFVISEAYGCGRLLTCNFQLDEKIFRWSAYFSALNFDQS